MAEITKVNGVDVEVPMEQVGRDLEWVLDTSAVDQATLNAANLALQTHCSVTIIGEFGAAGTMFGCEGVNSDELTGTQALYKLDADGFTAL